MTRTTGLERLAPVAAALGDAARVSQLMDAARRGYGVEPSAARFAIGGGRLVDAFCAHLAVAGAHALHMSATYRMKAEADIGFHTALHRVFDETAENVHNSKPEAITGSAPADWLALALDCLGESVSQQWGESGPEAASSVFLVLASNCACAIASLCPDGIDVEAIDLLEPEEELRAVLDPRGPASGGRFPAREPHIG